MKAKGRHDRVLSPDPLFEADFVRQRNTGCISDLAKFTTDEGDVEESDDFMNNPVWTVFPTEQNPLQEKECGRIWTGRPRVFMNNPG